MAAAPPLEPANSAHRTPPIEAGQNDDSTWLQLTQASYQFPVGQGSDAGSTSNQETIPSLPSYFHRYGLQTFSSTHAPSLYSSESGAQASAVTGGSTSDDGSRMHLYGEVPILSDTFGAEARSFQNPLDETDYRMDDNTQIDMAWDQDTRAFDIDMQCNFETNIGEYGPTMPQLGSDIQSSGKASPLAPLALDFQFQPQEQSNFNLADQLSSSGIKTYASSNASTAGHSPITFASRTGKIKCLVEGCTMEYISEAWFRGHVRDNHGHVYRFTCVKCFLDISEDEIGRHCNAKECGASRQSLIKRIAEVRVGWACRCCGMFFGDCDSIVNHWLLHHRNADGFSEVQRCTNLILGLLDNPGYIGIKGTVQGLVTPQKIEAQLQSSRRRRSFVELLQKLQYPGSEQDENLISFFRRAFNVD